MALSEFIITDLSVLSGTVGVSPIPGRTQPYSDDLRKLINWAPTLVITMTMQAELDAKGAGTLGPDLAAQGIAWRHLPIPDFGVPDPDIRAAWPETSEVARRTLADGGRVLVHCFGGCGRSGMAIVRLMIEAGEEPQQALARLRKVRPCAVETDAQMRWAFGAG